MPELDLNSFINQWNKLDIKQELHEFLGLPDDEYTKWVLENINVESENEYGER